MIIRLSSDEDNMYTLDVCKKSSGKLWHRKLQPSTDDGLLFGITHTVSSSLSAHGRNVRFLHAAFDMSGDSFVGGDHQGNVFLFDLKKNRFALVQRMGCASTALAFGLRRRSEFLVALADYSLKCYDTDSRELVAWMKGHESAIHTVSLHASGRYAITSSTDTAQLWDLDTFQRKRRLNIKENVGITKVFFLPMSNTILTCFKDDSIFAWESDTLKCKFQLSVPEGKAPRFKSFAATRDGRLLVAGGRSRHLHVWALDTRKLLRIIQLPAKVSSVKQLEFLPDSFDGGANQVLGVLSQDGIMRFIHIHSCKLLFEVGGLDQRLNSAAVSPTGHHVVAVMDDGNLNVYALQALSAEVNKPPAPLLRLVKDNKMADNTMSSSAQTLNKKPDRALTRSQVSRPDDSKSTTSAGLPDGLSLDRLKAILMGYGEYPVKYRMYIWRCLLHLPENHAAFAAMSDKGTHAAYASLHQTYPIKSRKLLRVLQRTLSALAHWSPIFGETDFLPMMSFPFCKLFQNNQLICFETIATILVNWCQHWFEYFPNPPVNILGTVENVLAHHDKDLLHHLITHRVTSQIYCWPLLSTLFSEVLTREEWLRFFDHIFSNHPAFLLAAVAAYVITGRAALMHCAELEDFKHFFHHKNAMDVGAVIAETYRLWDTTPDDIHPRHLLEELTQLPAGQYPVFNKYPKFIVDYQVQERERIRQEELEYLRQRMTVAELEQETARREAEDEAWHRQQRLLLEAEETRRRLIEEEEQRLADQRTRLGALQRELKLKELCAVDAARRRALHNQQLQTEADVARLDQELRRKALLRDQETREVLEAADVRNADLKVQRNMLELELERGFTEVQQKLRSEGDAWRHLEDREAQNEVDKEKQDHQCHLQQVQRVSRDLGLAWQHAGTSLQGAERTQRLQMASHLPPPHRLAWESKGNNCLNDSLSSSEFSAQLSLDRGRHTLEERERNLMAEVRKLRTKIAQENRNKCPPPALDLES